MSGWVNFSGSLKKEGTALLTADSRALRYGDGLFETMRIVDGTIKLGDLHFQRLFAGTGFLQIALSTSITAAFLEKEILRTVKKNEITGSARARLTVFRGEGGLYETNGPGTGYLIQCWPLQSKDKINDNGLVIGVYDEAQKNCDRLSAIKSNNYLLYVMAALHAKNNRWNDCLVMNNFGRVCDATIANVFWIKNNIIFTPPLSEGCIAGVMRQHLLESLPPVGYDIRETPVDNRSLREADEIFLTNAIAGIRWVKELEGQSFGNKLSSVLFQQTF